MVCSLARLIDTNYFLSQREELFKTKAWNYVIFYLIAKGLLSIRNSGEKLFWFSVDSIWHLLDRHIWDRKTINVYYTQMLLSMNLTMNGEDWNMNIQEGNK